MLWLIVLAIILMIIGRLLLSRATMLRHESGLPTGRLIYADTDERWRPNDNPLYSAMYHLTGKPDYLVDTPQGIIPVEVKSAQSPDLPYLGHLLQLAAYCLLVEESTGHAPPHGLLKYANALYEVDYTPELRRELLDTIAEIREAWQVDEVRRNHNQPNKCRACGFYQVCEEALD
ncbi:MAG: CRISPR-associated protein Cas4 [Anaerolineae bacterium]|nr:CRISPR-associated protein Cas4 [Anaerolineae bacterium]